MNQIKIKWEKHKGNPVHRCFVDGVQWTTYHPRVIKDNNIYFMYYSAARTDGMTRIHLATSTDLLNWEDHPENPVLDVGKEDWESHRVTYPFVIRGGKPGYKR